ncbi:uncharacterized protein LOC143292372 isoform X2 [Babylonia areolata]|uniref:uncharacterized protein LOC143292372 isoform X2 n=1 Tax=Babylonia areolata TaxID=304850 RepID=UPI003FD52A8A
MSVLQVYLSWASSVLSEAGLSIEGVSGIQEGQVLCQIIDILVPEAGLVAKIQASGVTTQRAYIQMALEHMKTHGVKLSFSAQDIIDGDIKSVLDVMWLLILNYGIHFIGEKSSQRGVGAGKRALIEWCQGELDVEFDPKNSITFSLCSENRFANLLQKFAGHHFEDTQDKISHLSNLLQEMEERYGIKQSIVSASDITDGTVDDHTLMIYLSLLRRRVCNTARRREMFSVEGKEAALEKERIRSVSEEPPNRRRQSELVTLTQQLQLQQQKHLQRSTRSASMDSSLAPPPARSTGGHQSRSQESVESSDWLSSDTNSLISGRERSPGDRGNFLLCEAEQVLRQTISEKVKEHLPTSDRDEDKDTDASQGHSGKETESISEFSSGALDEGYITNRKEITPRSSSAVAAAKERTSRSDTFVIKRPAEKQTGSSGSKKPTESEGKLSGGGGVGEKSMKIRIKRPKDYFLQWEETIDRLSQGPPDPPDVSDMSPRSPRQILRGIEDVHTPRSRSASSESDVYGGHYTPVWRRKDYLEKRPGSLSPSGHFDELAYSPRSNSLPLSITQSSSRGRPAERRASPSPGSGDKNRRKSTGDAKQTDRSKKESQRNGQGRHGAEQGSSGSETAAAVARSGASDRQEISLPDIDGNSAFMERLEELKRSGRAQRVILPDLGPDAPVLMIPGQGEEVLLLFDALRQARLEVNLNMAKASGSANGTTDTPSGQSPGRSSPPPQNEDSTELKRVVKTDKNTSKRSTGHEESTTNITGRLPRPTVHRHHFSKSTDVHLASLRACRDSRRAKSLTEKSSPVNTDPDSSRHHSLSPPRQQSPFGADRLDITRAQPDRSTVTFRDASADRMGVSLSSPTRRSLSRDSSRSVHRSYRSSPVTLSENASASPFRRSANQSSYHSLSPVKLTSSLDSPDRMPPLELPEDLASPRPRAGGLGRVPRREAWERQRQRTDPSGADSSAQAKFIEVLCKEIEELKHKIEIMEDSQAESSPERSSPYRVRPSTPTGQTGTFYTSRSEIQETDDKMVLAPRGDSPSVVTQRVHQSPKPWESPRSSAFSPSRASPPPRSGHTTSVSPRRQFTSAPSSIDRSSGRQSPSPDRSHTDSLSPRRRTTAGDASSSRPASRLSMERSSEASSQAGDARTSSGVRERSPAGRSAGRGISLGYKSPIRSVTQEIWGKDLTSVEGLDPDRKDNYKRLIAQSSLTEEEVIELKQSLASAVVENDILQAKLNNARHEIQDKLSKTNEVLDDCRRHLAKSQAENMELRTALEREKDRAETSEARVRDLQQIVQQVRADNDELEQELDHTLSILDRSKPGIDALKHQNAQLQGRASIIQNENSSLKREMDDLRKSHFKSVNTIRELRTLLDEVREERSDLQQKVSTLERCQSESKVKSIMMHYSQEKGAQDETENEYSSSGVSSCSERSRPPQSHHHHHHHHYSPRPSSRGEEVTTSRSTPTKGIASSSGISGGGPVRASSPGQGLSYSYEDLSPTVPSNYREIYPHRKPRYQGLSAERYLGAEDQDSPVDFIDYPDLQHYPTKLDPPLDLGDDYHQDEDAYRKPTSSRDASPILKPTPYRPYLEDNKSSYTTTTALNDSFEERAADSITGQARGRSPGRRSRQGLNRESRSSSRSPVPRGLSGDRLNRSFDAATTTFEHRKGRSASSSPGRQQYQDGRRGILKKGGRTPRDRSCSPHYYGGARSHSPPTRLSPDNSNKDGNSGSRKLMMFPRSQAGQIARDLQREFDKEDLILDGLRKKHSTKSWFELQLLFCREEHLLLSEEQRSYANELIKKYTGLKL